MGRAWAQAFPETRGVLAAADRLLGRELSKVCFEGPAEVLDRTDVAQPALFAVAAAVLAALRARFGVEPSAPGAALGLSLGEYTALHAAGSLSFEEGLRLVSKRGESMQRASEARPSGMASVLGLPEAAVEEACREASRSGVCAIANRNAPGQVVIGGENAALDAAEGLLRSRGARRVVRLRVAGAFHTECMRPAAEALAAELARVEILPPRVPFYSNVTGGRVGEPSEIRSLLAAQVCSPVLWESCQRSALRAGVRRYLELPPGNVLRGLLRKIDPQSEASGAEEPGEWEAAG
jgi:[acyl-carrier-protein] S-malonyltransferase